MKTIFSLIYEKEQTLCVDYLQEIKVYELFKPILELDMYEIKEDDIILQSITFDEKDKIDLVKFIVYCFSFDSSFIKDKLDLFYVFEDVGKYLNAKKDVIDLIIGFKFSQFLSIVNIYLQRQDPDFRVLKTAQILYEEFITTCTRPIYKSSKEVDYETKKYLFDQSLKLKDVMYELEQKAQGQNPEFTAMKTKFQSLNKKSLNTEDLISNS